MKAKARDLVSLRRLAWTTAILLATLLGIAALPTNAMAASFQQGQAITVGPGQTVNDDIYAAGSTIDIQGTVNGDVIAAGSTITISGTVTRDVIATGSSVDIPGHVQGTARVAGSTITVKGTVDGDLAAAGTTVSLGAGSSVGRDLMVAGQSVTIAGSVARDLRLGAVDATIGGSIGRNVIADVQTLRLQPGATVGGNLDYVSQNQVAIDSGASVAGTIHRTAASTGQPTALDMLIGWVRLLVGFFLLGLVLILVIPGFDRTARTAVSQAPWTRLGLGLLLGVLTPMAALFVFALGLLVGGWWISVLLLFLYVIALVVAYALVGQMIGRFGLSRVGQADAHPLLALLVGLFVLTVVGLVPVLGGIVNFAALVYGLGALSLAVFASIGSTSGAPGGTTAAPVSPAGSPMTFPPAASTPGKGALAT